MANAFFSDLLSTISERSRTLLRRGEPADGKHDASELIELCQALLSGRGEASGITMAREVLDGYHDLDASDLHFASEPRRQELFRRLNRAPGGTGELVQMRADLLDALKGRGELAALDRDVVHLLSSWFNRGFLVLRRIDWSTPANILEQIIRY